MGVFSKLQLVNAQCHGKNKNKISRMGQMSRQCNAAETSIKANRNIANSFRILALSSHVRPCVHKCDIRKRGGERERGEEEEITPPLPLSPMSPISSQTRLPSLSSCLFPVSPLCPLSYTYTYTMYIIHVDIRF